MKKLLIFAALAVSTVPLAAHADSPQEKQRERYADRIENALERDSLLARFDLDADSKGDVTGYIKLEGKVLNQSQRNRAMQIAHREAPGYAIQNHIVIGQPKDVNSSQKAQRKRTADRIEDAFKRDGELARFDLDADAEGDVTGYIELEGKVRSASQRNRAVAIARRVAPGYTLRNKIVISAKAGRDD